MSDIVERQIEQRDRILDYLGEHGGATLDNITDAVAIDREVVRNLVRQLQGERLVTRSGVDGGALRYQATGPPHPSIQEQDEAAAVDSEEEPAVVEPEQRDGDVLDYVRSNPDGVKTADVAEHLGVSPDTARTALRRLADDGTVVEDNEGRAAIWQPAG